MYWKNMGGSESAERVAREKEIFFVIFSQKYIDKHENVCYNIGTTDQGGTKMIENSNEVAVVKALMKAKGKSAAYIAEAIYGEGTPASKVGNRLQSKTMNVETLIRILDVLECELIIRDKVGNKQSVTLINDDRQPVRSYSNKKEEN